MLLMALTRVTLTFTAIYPIRLHIESLDPTLKFPVGNPDTPLFIVSVNVYNCIFLATLVPKVVIT